MGESKTEDKKPKHLTKRKEEGIIETSLQAPFPFDYIEKQLRKKTFGILTTVTPQGRRIQLESSMLWRRQVSLFVYI